MSLKSRFIKISVKEFALPIPRRGHIESISGFGRSALDGIELHKQIQQQRHEDTPGYESEFSIVHKFPVHRHIIEIAGRIDGIVSGEPIILEEIKTTNQVRELKERLTTNPWHPYALQLQTYGYLYFRQTGVLPQLQFVLACQRREQAEVLPITFNLEQAEQWFYARLQEVFQENVARAKMVRRRKRIARQLSFPFQKLRPGQAELIAAVEDGIETKVPQMLQAPTGLGKTLGVLYPELKDALSRGAQTLYLTPKNSQHLLGEEAARLLRKETLPLKSLTVTAKTKSCLKAEPLCRPDYCEYARDYYAKVAEYKLLEQVTLADKIDGEALKSFGLTYEVCPYYLSMDAASKADLVIGDYNYVLSPSAALSHLSGDDIPKQERPNLVIDEAHNLPARAMDYFSPQFTQVTLERLGAAMIERGVAQSHEGQRLATEAVNLIVACAPDRPDVDSAPVKLEPWPFVSLSSRIQELLAEYLAQDLTIESRDPFFEFANYVQNFAESLFHEGQQYFTTYRRGDMGESLKITCCDASDFLADKYGRFNHVAAFSATLKPFAYYRDLAGFPQDKTTFHEFLSPFPRENKKILLIPQISTRLKHRLQSYERVAQVVNRVLPLRQGNYFVFFPSFEFLFKTLPLLNLPDFEVIAQQRDLSRDKIEAVIASLKNPSQGPICICAVQGGVFSEGLDFPGDQLIGAIVVGPALPTFNLERNLMAQYYDNTYGSGFDYAYTYPAMARVVQAAGRVIRSETDRGLIMLIDDRFLQPSYSQVLPNDWVEKSPKELVSKSILKDVTEFWDATPDSHP